MTAPAGSTESIHLPGWVSFYAVAAGIKASGRLDLALAEAGPGTTAAAVFTKNRVIAAPVEIGRKHLRATGAHVRAVIVNSGNANCATGKAGINDCLQVCRKASALLGFKAELVFPSSTGIIGVPMPVSKILAALPTLIAAHEASEHAVMQFARAIMTTDTRPKLASAQFQVRGKNSSILGIAEGSGMIHPQLATMLVYLFTDVMVTPPELKQCLWRSYHHIGEQIHQHGCKLGMNHAGSLGYAQDATVLSSNLKLRGCELRPRVGGHDRAGKLHYCLLALFVGRN